MATAPFRDKYYLKTLHEDIGLLDRKLAHLLKYETFPTDKEHNAAAAKLATKRAQLARTAQEMIDAGIEFKPSELPNSMRPATEAAAVATAAVPAEPEPSAPVAVAPEAPAFLPVDAVYAGTSLDYRSNLTEYMRSRRKSA